MVFDRVDEREVDTLVERMKQTVERVRSTSANDERRRRMEQLAEEIKLRHR